MAEYWRETGSIAEMHVFEELNNLARMSYDTLRDFREFVDVLINNGDQVIAKAYEKLRSRKHRVEENKVMVMEYLVRLGRALEEKDMYASIALSLDKTVQKIDGAAYRLYMFIANKYSFDNELHSCVSKFVEKLLEEYNMFYDGLNLLRSNPRRCIKNMEQVVKLEEELDKIYRSSELELFKKLADNIPALMIMKDAMDFIEDVADIIKEAGETLRYLALHRAALE